MPTDPLNPGPDPGQGNFAQPQQPSGAGTMTGFIKNLVNIGAQRRNAAAADLDKMLLAARGGFPVDPKAVAKTAKKAGIPLADHTDMQGMLQFTEGAQPKPGENPNPIKPEGQEQGADPHAQAYNVKAITDVKERQKVETSHGVDGIIRQAVTNAHLRGANQQQILESTQQLMGLKQQALDGDPRALGKLAAAGEMSIDVPTNVWQSYNPKQKMQYLEMQRGAESEAQKNARIQASATNLIDSGAFTSPEAAYQAATMLADGKGLSPDMRAKMRPTSLEDLTKEVAVFGKLTDIGLGGAEAWNMARGANLTGTANYFPKGFQTTQQKMLSQKDQELSIQRQQANTGSTNAATSRMEVQGYDTTSPDGKKVHVAGTLENAQAERQIRLTEAQNIGARIQAYAKTQDAKDLVAQYTALVDIKRAGGVVDPEVLAMYEAKLVKMTGGQVTIDQVKGFWQTVTFGLLGSSTPKLKVGMSPEAAQKTFGMDTDLSPSTPETDPATAGAGGPQ